MRPAQPGGPLAAPRIAAALLVLVAVSVLAACDDKKSATAFMATVEAEIERLKKAPGCASIKTDDVATDYTATCINDTWRAVVTGDGKGAKAKVFAVELYPSRAGQITQSGAVPEPIVKAVAQTYGFAPDKAAEWYRGDRKTKLTAGKMQLGSRGAGTILFDILD